MLYAKFGRFEIIDTHQFAIACARTRRNMARIPDKEFPKFSSRTHCLAYQLFADACQELDVIQYQYYRIIKLEVHDLGNGVWRFDYVVKHGWFNKEKISFTWDQDWKLKEKQREKEKKEEEKRNRPRRILRRR